MSNTITLRQRVLAVLSDDGVNPEWAEMCANEIMEEVERDRPSTTQGAVEGNGFNQDSLPPVDIYPEGGVIFPDEERD